MAPKEHDSNLTRSSLLIRCKDLDDDESWRDFFDKYWKLIYNLARSQELTDVEAREVVQETIIKISKKLPGFQYDPAKGSFRSWLLHTAQWKIKDQLRKRRHQFYSLDAPAEGENESSPLDNLPDPIASDVAAAWERDYEEHLRELALKNVKQQVNAKQFQIFDLYVLKEWPVEKVAKTLNVSAARIYLAKFRIIEALKKEIRRLEQQAL
ncbi:MAG: sigma-70 family RNA polymerase sigma factor [Verrucomicrobia bacterium]|nr:sigma-70 family RNA polymerase sigma factor [Verrucomicrobiota bacterium]